MSMRYPGGLIATSPVNAAYPSGVWTPSQSIPYQQQNVWTRDQYWPYTTLLLNGNGTNGAQNNTFLDSSSNGFTITRNGNTTQGSFSPYQTNGYWSNYFDGTDDYLTYANNTAFAFGTGAFTIEFWVNSNGVSDGFILSGRAAIGTMHITYGGFGGSTAGSLRYVGSSTITSGSVLISNGAWNHCAIVRDGSNNITLYVNGVSVGTGTDSTNYTTTSGTWYINANDSGPTAGGAGYISNLRIVKGTVVYTAAFTPPNTPLTAITNTSLLTCQSNRFIDNSTNAFAITRNGDTSVQAFQPFPGATTWSGSVLGGSGYFDGTGDYLTTSSNTPMDFGTGNFTIEGWFFTGDKSVSSGASRTIIGNSGNSYTMQVYISTSGFMTFGNTGSTFLQGSTDLANNAWHHFAISRSGTGSNQIAMWVDGTRVAQGTNTQNYTSGTIYLGGFDNASGFWNGYVSNLRIVKGTAVYDPSNSTITVPTSPLTAITNTSLLLNFTNAGIFDSAMMNDLETVGNAQVSTSVVKYGTGSMLFDGSGDYLVRPDAEFLRLSSGDFTIEAWVYLTGNQPQFDGGVASYGATTTSAGWTVAITGSSAGGTLNRLVYGVNASASGGAPLYGVNGIALNTWTHIAVTKSGTTVRLFINGSLDNSGTVTATPTTSTSYFFYVGTQAYDPTATTRQFAGYIDDFRLTKGYARYITNFTPPPARLPPQ